MMMLQKFLIMWNPKLQEDCRLQADHNQPGLLQI
jgi:hypothetical protein